MPGKAMVERFHEVKPTAVANIAGSIPAGGTGQNAGGWANSTDRNTALTTLGEIKTQLNAVLTELRARGLIAGTASKRAMVERFYDSDPTTVADVAGTIPSGGTGATAGGWDTAGNRNTAITTFTEIKTQLNALLVRLRYRGFLAGSAVVPSMVGTRLYDQPAIAIDDVAGSIPAGGTGAAGGCYDSAANRNTMITTATELKTQLNALLDELRARGVIL